MATNNYFTVSKEKRVALRARLAPNGSEWSAQYMASVTHDEVHDLLDALDVAEKRYDDEHSMRLEDLEDQHKEWERAEKLHEVLGYALDMLNELGFANTAWDRILEETKSD